MSSVPTILAAPIALNSPPPPQKPGKNSAIPTPPPLPTTTGKRVRGSLNATNSKKPPTGHSGNSNSLPILEEKSNDGKSTTPPPSIDLNDSPSSSSTFSTTSFSHSRGNRDLSTLIVTLLAAGLGYATASSNNLDKRIVSIAFGASVLSIKLIYESAKNLDVTDAVNAWKLRSFGYLLTSVISIAALRALGLLNQIAVYTISAAVTAQFIGNILKMNQAKNI